MNKQEVLEKLEELGFNVQKISELTGIPSARIYKWYDKKGSPKLADFNKLKDLYEKMKPKPTNDFHCENKNQAAEEQVPYLTAEEQIKLLKEVNEMKEQQIKQLKIELDEYKSKVVDVGKTGGRRNSS